MMREIEQVGGTHYRDSTGVCPSCRGPIQHWDWAGKLPGLEYAATKYTARHASKAGFQDLLKAVSYIEKIMQRDYPQEYAERSKVPDAEYSIFSASSPGAPCDCGQPFAAHHATYRCP
jgi:hypothetical protein